MIKSLKKLIKLIIIIIIFLVILFFINEYLDFKIKMPYNYEL